MPKDIVARERIKGRKFSENYKEACFMAWYRAGQPKAQKILDYLPIDSDTGEIPRFETVRDWIADYDWHQRADAMDGEMSIILEKETIEKRAADLRKIAETAKKTMEMGLSYLETEGFDSAASAVRAVLGGAEQYAKYAGMADIMANVGKMSNKQLDDFVTNLLGKQDKYNDEALIVDSEDVDEDEDENK